MGIAASALGIEEIIAGIIGAGEAASAAGEAAAAAAAAGESASAAISAGTGISEAASQAGAAAASAIIEAGGTTAEAIAAAGAAIGEEIAGVELTEIGELISGITGVPGGGLAGGGISSATGIETLGDIPAAISDLISGGTITEEAGIELVELGEVTAEDIAETGLSTTEFHAFEIESSEAFEGLDNTATQQWNEIKQLGANAVDRVKASLLACMKNIVNVSTCVIALTEAIKGIHKIFFKKGPGSNPNVIPSFRGADPFELGKTVGNLTARGISVYYDELVKNPALSRDEKAIDNLILKSFKGITNSLHNTLSRQIYKIIRTSKFISLNKNVQKKFDDVFKVATGELKSFPFRDTKTGHITAIDELGRKFAYTGVTNLSSHTTFFGYWCGPLSYNNSYPIWDGREPEKGVVSRPSGSGLLDSFCMLHDQAYDVGGYFNQDADFRLISRIIHTQQHMTSKERSLALMTVAWFSTLGTILNSYLHPLTVQFQGRDPTKAPQQEDEKNDIFSLLFPPKPVVVKTNTNQIVLAGSGRINESNDKQQESDRKSFYRGLKSALDNSFVEFVSTKGGGSANSRHVHSNLLAQFDSMLTVEC